MIATDCKQVLLPSVQTWSEAQTSHCGPIQSSSQSQPPEALGATRSIPFSFATAHWPPSLALLALVLVVLVLGASVVLESWLAAGAGAGSVTEAVRLLSMPELMLLLPLPTMVEAFWIWNPLPGGA